MSFEVRNSLGIALLIEGERCEAQEKYGAFKSAHEGYGVLAEEVAELLDAIHGNDAGAIQREAIQCAAVAQRLAESMGNPECRKRSGCV